MEKFDFSKIEDSDAKVMADKQKKFDTLPEKEREEIVDGAREEAEKIDEKVKKNKSKNYSEIEKVIEDKDKKKEIVLKMEQQIAKECFIQKLKWSKIDKAVEISNAFSLPEEFVQQVVKEKFINRLENTKISDAIEIKNAFSLPEEFVQQAARESFISSLKSESILKDIFRIKDTFSLPEKFIQSQEVQQAAKEGFIYCLNRGYIINAHQFENTFSLPKDFVQKTAKEKFIYRLQEGYSPDDTFKIKDTFSLPEKFIQSQEVQQAAKEGFVNQLSEGWINNAIKIKNEFNLPKEFLSSNEAQQAVREGFIDQLKNQFTNNALEIKNTFSLPEEFVQQAVKEVFIYTLKTNTIYNGTELTKTFPLPEEFIQSNEVQQAAKQGLINQLSDGGINSAIEIKDSFSLSVHPYEITGRVPELKNLLSGIQDISPNFYEQAYKSKDVAISLLEFLKYNEYNSGLFFKIIKENPFLVDAVAENTRFGSKLLLKFPQLDELSQQNIEFLFDTKKEILKENPDIDPESLEFRQLMQEKLKNYEDNPDILEEMKRNGININKWLNYEGTSHFSLESGKSKLAFSETVSTPLNRIKETIGSYAYQIKEVLKEYKQELLEHQIPVENPKDIEDKIAQMREEQEKARAERNEKKAQGIQKGIDGLTQKLADLKTVSSWHKILGDINAFDQLKNDVFGTQEKLIQAENEFAEKTSGKTPSGKEIQDAKQRIAKAKEELRNKFGLLENRIENFKTNLPNLIEPALGKERTEALIQEIETNLAEQFDHYDTDRSDLANLFSEKSDKEKDKMDSQPMSIFVWARNPDIDLYQGNYSECCIKINSDHMGAESTIADYNTDLGVQIVNIWDETKNEPVTAAWCWIGKSEKGKPVLVVDNIESNTLYSSNYPEQLTKELFDYLKNYAKSIGVKKIVLGKANNDLPTGGELAKLIDDKSEYEKIGGYNRADGYFLEAEDKSVKIVWEAKQKESESKAKEKNKITEVEFTEANARDLNENDFETIKKMERKVYRGTDLIQGQAMIEDIKSGKGLDYSTILYGKNSKTGKTEAVGYIVAVEDETDEGNESVYLEDIAVLPETQGQGLGWNLFKSFIEKLKAKALKENKPILFDMHLRENSQRFMERHRQEIEEAGVKLIEESLVADYYDEGEDALYQVYEVK